jgi:hypothetical protein
MQFLVLTFGIAIVWLALTRCSEPTPRARRPGSAMPQNPELALDTNGVAEQEERRGGDLIGFGPCGLGRAVPFLLICEC